MKNLTISILAGFVISDAQFWQYIRPYDKAFVIVGTAFIIFCLLVHLDERIMEYRKMKWRAERFRRQVEELQEWKREQDQKNRP